MDVIPTQPLPSTTQITTKRIRTWPAALTLLWLSPLIAEMMSGSTPPLLFLQPFALIVLPTLYGISALLIHEISVRRQLGWGNILLMGAAFGIFQEALVVQTWFNFPEPASPSHSSGTYGVLWQTNWDWGLNLTIYHAVISITLPFMLLNLFYPQRARLPWLGTKHIIVLTTWLLLLCGVLAWYVAFKAPGSGGYTHPPLAPYLVTVGLTILTFVLGCFLRFPVRQPTLSQLAPKLWIVRLLFFGLMLLLFLGINLVLPTTHVPAVISMLFSLAILSFGLWRVRSWSARVGWGTRHHLAIATGILLYFILVFGPLVEFVVRLPGRAGITAVNGAIFVGLLCFDWYVKRRERAEAARLDEKKEP